eukprot:sb/3463742/
MHKHYTNIPLIVPPPPLGEACPCETCAASCKTTPDGYTHEKGICLMYGTCTVGGMEYPCLGSDRIFGSVRKFGVFWAIECVNCYHNLAKLFCNVFCHSDQSLFTVTREEKNGEEGDVAIPTFGYFVEERVGQELWNSCKDNSGSIITIICQMKYGRACDNYMEFAVAIGESQATSFTINFEFEASDPFQLDSPGLLTCDETFQGESCDCKDCEAACKSDDNYPHQRGMCLITPSGLVPGTMATTGPKNNTVCPGLSGRKVCCNSDDFTKLQTVLEKLDSKCPACSHNIKTMNDVFEDVGYTTQINVDSYRLPDTKSAPLYGLANCYDHDPQYRCGCEYCKESCTNDGYLHAPNTCLFYDICDSDSNHSNHLGNHSNPLGNHINPLGNHSNPLGNHSNPLGKDSNPLGNHSNLLVNHSNRLGNHSNPLGNHSNPLGNRSNPLGNHSNPLGNHSNPLGNHSNHLGNHSNPLGTHNNHLGNHNNPLGNRSNLLVNHSNPLGNLGSADSGCVCSSPVSCPAPTRVHNGWQGRYTNGGS